MTETKGLYGCLCVGDAPLLGEGIERGLVAAAVHASEMGERGPPIEKVASDATHLLRDLDNEARNDPLVLSRTFDEPLPVNEELVDRGVFVFVGDPAGAAPGAAAFLIRPAAESPESLTRRFLQVADRVAELAETLRAKVAATG